MREFLQRYKRKLLVVSVVFGILAVLMCIETHQYQAPHDLSGRTGPTQLSGLSDVDTTGVSNGEVIAYTSATGLWEPSAGGGGGGITEADITGGTGTSTAIAETDSPMLDFYRDDASPTQFDFLGTIQMQGNDDGGGKDTYLQMITAAAETGAGSEEGIFIMRLADGGALPTGFDNHFFMSKSSLALTSFQDDDSGYELSLNSKSSSPADGDVVGQIKFTGNDSGGSGAGYGEFYSEIVSTSTGAVESKFVMSLPVGGSTFPKFEFSNTASTSTVQIGSSGTQQAGYIKLRDTDFGGWSCFAALDGTLSNVTCP